MGRLPQSLERLLQIARQMPPVVYATNERGETVCMVKCTSCRHIAQGVTADEMNDLWRVSPAARAAAQAALQHGWTHPLADPRAYNEKGELIHGSNHEIPHTAQAHAERS